MARAVSEVLVIGHRNPDLDSIAAAIGYAEFKRQTGLAEAEAARCGDTNERIDFVLQRFGLPAPRFVADVTPKVGDVMQRRLLTVTPETPMAEALALMDEHDLRILPVLAGGERCLGLVSVFKMMEFQVPGPGRLFASRRVLATLDGLVRTLGAEVVHRTEDDSERDLTLMIGGMSRDSFAERLRKSRPENLLIAVGDRHELQRLAVAHRVFGLVVTGGLRIRDDVVAAAREQGVNLLLSPHDTMTTAMLCRSAIAVRHLLEEEYQHFSEDEPLRTARAAVVGSESHVFPVLDEAGRARGILSKSDFLRKVDRRLILVDHNELSQAVRGADQVEILEVIDHHRIGTLSTNAPIFFLNDPVGSTSTIVANCFFRDGVELPPPIAGVLLAGLVADTLNLQSPTATDRDAAVLRRLERIAGVDATAFAEAMFSTGSVLTSRPAREAITGDCKEYEEAGQRFSVAQIEEIGFERFWERKDEVAAALAAYRAERGYRFSALLITDVVRQNSLLLLAADEAFVARIDHPELEPGLFQLNDVVSRKKQLLPYLTHCLHRTSG